jgi:hypothetical protein
VTDQNKKTVATPSDAAAAMHDGVRLVRTLMGGTDAMRAAGKTYLPKNEAEAEDAYKVRKDRSVLFNAFAKTVEDMTGKVFSKPIVLKDNVPAELVAYAEDIDLEGTHLNLFACSSFKDAMQAGIGFFLTDAPEAPETTRALTKAETNAQGIRPYLTYIKVERLLGWKSQRINGVQTLTQVRIMECVSKADGDFHDTEIEQVRVIERDKWRTFRKNEQEEWAQVGTGVNPIGKITLTPFYTNRTGFMTGCPPLEKLAELNVAHWQLDSDLSNITHVAQVPILFLAGFTEADKFVIGAAEAIRSIERRRRYEVRRALPVLRSAPAARGSRKSNSQMQVMGLQLLTDKPGQTATGEVRDNVKENSPLAMMADGLKDALEVSFGFMAEYENLGPDKGGELEVNKDFGIQAGAMADVPNILTAKRDGTLDHRTALAELKRRGFLSDSVDPETVISRSKDEMAASLDTGNPMDLGAGGGA